MYTTIRCAPSQIFFFILSITNAAHEWPDLIESNATPTTHIYIYIYILSFVGFKSV